MHLECYERHGLRTRTATCTALFPLGLVVPGDKGVPGGLTRPTTRHLRRASVSRGAREESGKTSIRAGWGCSTTRSSSWCSSSSAPSLLSAAAHSSADIFNTPFQDQRRRLDQPNPFNGILNSARGQPVDWSVFRPILLVWAIPAASARAIFGAIQLRYPARTDQGSGVCKSAMSAPRDIGCLPPTISTTATPQTCLDLQNISELTGDADLA